MNTLTTALADSLTTTNSPSSLTILNLSVRPSTDRRNGKIARLPKATRDMINHMLDDGLPYPVIIDELGQFGEGLNAQNLTNWKNGGYQDYLKIQEMIDRTKAQAEVAAEILRETEGMDSSTLMEACRVIAAVQVMKGLMENGDESLKKILLDKPNGYISILNVICNLAKTGLKIDKSKLELEVAQAKIEASCSSLP
jgi:hypothetical protein